MLVQGPYMSDPYKYGFKLGFEAGYVEAVATPAAEYRTGTDPYSLGYMAGWASDGRGANQELESARRESIRGQQATWAAERRAYRKAWHIEDDNI